jgi:hypothetical protein
MDSGRGTPSRRAAKTASDLASGRVGGIGSMRLGHAVLLFLAIIETYNKHMQPSARRARRG